MVSSSSPVVNLQWLLAHSLSSFKRRQLAVHLLWLGCHGLTCSFHRISCSSCMSTWINLLHMDWVYNCRCLPIPKYLNCPSFFGPLLPLVLANWRIAVAYLMYVASQCDAQCSFLELSIFSCFLYFLMLLIDSISLCWRFILICLILILFICAYMCNWILSAASGWVRY